MLEAAVGEQTQENRGELGRTTGLREENRVVVGNARGGCGDWLALVMTRS